MNPDPSILIVSDSMSKVELGAAIHSHLELHPGGEVRIESKDEGKTVTIRVTEDALEKLSPAEPSPRPHVNIGVIGRSSSLPMAAALLTSGAFSYFPKFAPSSKTVGNRPERVKTPEDLERIEAARAKQERKAAKRAKAGK